MFNIVIKIIQSKVIAVLLGPTGIGVMGLLTSTVGLIGSMTNFGLGTSAVKDVAAANALDNQMQVAEKVTVLRRLVWLTGLLGAFLLFVLAPWLSQICFGNESQTLGFTWLSVTLLLSQISSGQLVILQGMRRLRDLAKANMCGSGLGLLVTVPLYYIWGLDGIVPGMICTSLLVLALSWYFSRAVNLPRVTVSVRQTWSTGSDMMRMGFLISLSGLLTAGGAYLLRVFISQTGGIEDVGLFAAGFAMINSYVGLIFNAMGTDYYPRLSAVAHDNKLCCQVINQQAEIAVLILAPILILFLIFAQAVIELLYSDQFLPITEMLYWAAFGMFFKAASWSISFLFLAKGAGRIFFISELLVNLYMLVFNAVGYHYLGLKGLGISFIISYFIYLIQVYIIGKINYNFAFSKTNYLIFFNNLFLFLISLIFLEFFDKKYIYIFAIFSILYTIYTIKNNLKFSKVKI